MEPTQEETLEITCPICQTRMVVSRRDGQVLWHQEPRKSRASESLQEMIAQMEARQREAQERVAREQEALKERQRRLEEKVREAFRRVEGQEEPPPRPIDLD